MLLLVLSTYKDKKHFFVWFPGILRVEFENILECYLIAYFVRIVVEIFLRNTPPTTCLFNLAQQFNNVFVYVVIAELRCLSAKVHVYDLARLPR